MDSNIIEYICCWNLVTIFQYVYYFVPICSTIQFLEQNFAPWCIKIMSFEFTPSDRCQFFAPVFHEKVVTKNAVYGTGSFCLLRGLCLCLDTFLYHPSPSMNDWFLRSQFFSMLSCFWLDKNVCVICQV